MSTQGDGYKHVALVLCQADRTLLAEALSLVAAQCPTRTRAAMELRARLAEACPVVFR